MTRAACVGHVPSRSRGDQRDLFFPSKGETTKAGKEVCDTCPVRPECLIWSEKTDSTDGMWAGQMKSRRK